MTAPAWAGQRPLIRQALRIERRKTLASRGVLITTSLLTVGVTVVYLVVLIVQHAVAADTHPPAGGLVHLQNGASLLAQVGLIAAAILGATIGTQDVDTGVFRDQVATGRPRLLLYALRVGGLVQVLATQLVAGLVLLVAVGEILTGYLAAPGPADVLDLVGAVLLVGFYSLGLTLGLAALTDSRAISISVTLGFTYIVGPLLASVSVLGAVRDVLPIVAFSRVFPQGGTGPGDLRPALVVAVVVSLAWPLVALAAGALRTQTREA